MKSNVVGNQMIVNDWQNRTTTKLDLLITSMITDLIGRHDVLLPINYNRYHFQQTQQKKKFHL